MRVLLTLAAILVVMGLAFWAYRENYRTQATIDEMEAIQARIGALREDLAVLRAEWAWLNRPERLAELVDLNFERLKLLPLRADQFVPTDAIPYAPPPTPSPAPDAGDTTDETPATPETAP